LSRKETVKNKKTEADREKIKIEIEKEIKKKKLVIYRLDYYS
jgi:hypothetical protein